MSGRYSRSAFPDATAAGAAVRYRTASSTGRRAASDILTAPVGGRLRESRGFAGIPMDVSRARPRWAGSRSRAGAAGVHPGRSPRVRAGGRVPARAHPARTGPASSLPWAASLPAGGAPPLPRGSAASRRRGASARGPPGRAFLVRDPAHPPACTCTGTERQRRPATRSRGGDGHEGCQTVLIRPRTPRLQIGVIAGTHHRPADALAKPIFAASSPNMRIRRGAVNATRKVAPGGCRYCPTVSMSRRWRAGRASRRGSPRSSRRAQP